MEKELKEQKSKEGILNALFNLQGKAKPLKREGENPYTKSRYAPLDELWKEVLPLLRENKLLIIQVPVSDGNSVSLRTEIYHIPSGEKMIFEPLTLIPSKTDPQGIGSAITYARRYSLMSILGLVAEGEDDDANTASATEPKTGKPKERTDDDKAIIRKLITLFPKEGGGINFELWRHFLKRSGKKLSAVKISELKPEEKIWLVHFLDLLIKIKETTSEGTKEEMDEALNTLEFASPNLYEDLSSVNL